VLTLCVCARGTDSLCFYVGAILLEKGEITFREMFTAFFSIVVCAMGSSPLPLAGCRAASLGALISAPRVHPWPHGAGIGQAMQLGPDMTKAGCANRSTVRA
jgi:hypothetical protein